MSNQDGFAGGFLVGTIVGGLAGGLVGALLTARLSQDASANEAKIPENGNHPSVDAPRPKKRQLQAGSLEAVRRNLEEKIAQLNQAIDEVRQQVQPIRETTESPQSPQPPTGSADRP